MAMAGKGSVQPNTKRDESAVTYRVRPGVARVYVASGLLMSLVATAVLVVRPASFGKAYFNALFYLAAVAIAVLSVLRHRTCRLTLSGDDLYFYNGIIDVRRIPLDDVDFVEFNPEIRIRIHMRPRGRREIVHRLPNVFSEEDTEKILGQLEREHGIEVRLIEKPGKEPERKTSQRAREKTEVSSEEDMNG